MERELNSFFSPLYEGEGEQNQSQGQGQSQTVEPPAGSQDQGTTATTNQPGFSSEVQEHINRVIATEKRKNQQTAQKALDELNAIRARANLTEQEREELNSRVEQLSNELLTKEELQKKREKEMSERHERELSEWRTKAESAEKKYTETTIRRSLQDAAVTNQAYSPGQLVAILRPNTRLVEELDESGKPTGNQVPKVKLNALDSEGKPIVLELSPSDAVKKMKEMEEYLNLFRGEGVGGVGLRSQPGGQQLDISELAKDPAAYRKARAEGRIKF